MIRVLTYNEIDREEWSKLVQTSATGTWFQMPEAYEFFASQPKLFKPFVVGVIYDPAGAQTLLRGVSVGYVTVERNPIKQYFTRRAIIIGGPCFADDCTDEEVNALLCALKSTLLSGRDGVGSPIYIETRNFNSYEKWKGAFEKAGFEYKRHLNFHVDCTDKEKMWERLSETRRRQIRKVTNEGVKEFTNERVKELASEGVSEQDVREWYEILTELYRTKVKTPLWPVEFFLEFYRQKRGIYLLRKHEGKVIGGMMAVIMKPTPNPFLKEGEKEQPQNRPQNGAIYEWYICGLDAEYKEKYPSVMATWAAMEYANTHGLARFDVMGAGVPDVPYGVRDFKAEFGGQLVEHGRFICVREPLLYEIGALAVKMMKGAKKIKN